MVVTFSYKDLLNEGLSAEIITLPSCKDIGLKLEYSENETCDNIVPVYKDKSPVLPFARSEIYHVQISNSRRLTAVDALKAVYEVTFDVKDTKFEFKAGDTIGILPQNSPLDVNHILDHLGITHADSCYNLTADGSPKTKLPPHIPVKSTLRHVLTHCVDLRGVLKKTCQPPIHILLGHLPRLLPRPYSIVNSGQKDPNMLKICFSVMDLGNNRKGLTTGWLESQIIDTMEHRMAHLTLTNDCQNKVPMYLRQNMAGFCLPSNIETPLLLIATGTGVAPFLGFFEERQLRRTEKMGEAWLFFGCRDPNLDYLYQEELEQYEDNLTLTKLIPAFSRIQNEESRHIQDTLGENGSDVARLIEEGASVFVCGEAKTMVAQVRENIINYLIEYSGKTQEEARECISQMEKDKRFVVDLWS